MPRYLLLAPKGSGYGKVQAVVEAQKPPLHPNFICRELPPGIVGPAPGSLIRLSENDSPDPALRDAFVSIVIPTFKAGPKLDRCLESFRKYHASLFRYEIVVVLDGGPDEAEARAIVEKHGGRLIVLPENGGFSKAVNTGIRACSDGVECVILVNDDLWFEGPSCVSLVQTLRERPDAGIAGGLLLFPDGTIQHAGVNSDCVHLGTGQKPTLEMMAKTEETWSVTGALFAMSSRFLKQRGSFDEKFKLAWEDTDTALTAKLLGWKVYFCGSAVAYHEEGGTRGRTDDRKRQNPKWFDWDVAGGARFYDKWVDPRISRLRRGVILVRRLWAAGDLVLLTSVLRALHEKKPDQPIAVVTNCGYVFRDNPAVEFVLPEDHFWLKQKQYEEFIDLDLSYESQPLRHCVDVYAEKCGVSVPAWKAEVFLREGDRRFAAEHLPDSGWVVLHHQTTRWPGRDWEIERFQKVASYLQAKGWKVVVVGQTEGLNKSVGPIPCKVDLRSRTSFHQLAAVIERADMFVGIESMPMHLAQAFGKPGIGLCGSIAASLRRHPGSRIKIVTADPVQVPCLGCHHRRPGPRTKGACDQPSPYCMDKLSVMQVLEAIDAVERDGM